MAARIARLREHAGFSSQKALADALGLSAQAVQYWESGFTRPTGVNLKRLAKALAVTEVEIIADSPGSTTDARRARALAPGTQIVEWSGLEDLPPDQYVRVPRVRVELAAGNGHLVEREDDGPPLAFRADWLRKRNLVRTNVRVVYVSGHSMEPYLQDGDTVLIDLGSRSVRDGEVYALRYGDEVRVKRLFKRVDGGLIVRSDNSAQYPDEQVSGAQLEHVEIIGKVVWRGG